MVKYMLEFYKNKKVLITGHTGFKGSWLALWLNKAGANVCGYALAPQTEPSLFDILNLSSKIKSIIADINDQDALSNTFEEFKPEIVFHLAAQPLVRKSYMEPVLTYKTNVMGTLNVLEAARISGSVKAFVNVTTEILNKITAIRSLTGLEVMTCTLPQKLASKFCLHRIAEAFWIMVRPLHFKWLQQEPEM